MQAGDVITLEKITTKRPAISNHIPASDYYDIVGKRLTRDVGADCILTVKDFV